MTSEIGKNRTKRNDFHRFVNENYGIYFKSQPDIEDSIHVKDLAPGILVLKQKLPFSSKFAYPLVFDYSQNDMCVWRPVALDDSFTPDLTVMSSCGELFLGNSQGLLEGMVSIHDKSKKLHKFIHDKLFQNSHIHKFGSLVFGRSKIGISLILFDLPSEFDYESSLTYGRYAALKWLYNEHTQNNIKVPDVVTLGTVWNRI